MFIICVLKQRDCVCYDVSKFITRFLNAELSTYIVNIDTQDENITFSCESDKVIVPRYAALYTIDPMTLQETDYCNGTETFERACRYDNCCTFTKTEFLFASTDCITQQFGYFGYDCSSGNEINLSVYRYLFLIYNELTRPLIGQYMT